MTRRIYPAVDLLEGKAVRLHQGDRASAKVYSVDPAGQARSFALQGSRWVHVVDLDAAFGAPRQLELLGSICRAARSAGAEVQVGGGVRDLEAIEATLDAGASRVILGTAAVEHPELVPAAVLHFRSQVAVGIDVRDGRVAVRGWTEASGPAATELAARLQRDGIRCLVVTAVARDGTLGGFDLELLSAVCRAAPACEVIASGGAGTLEHLRELQRIPGIRGAIAGTALYEGRFTLSEAQRTLGEPPRWLSVRGDYAISTDPDLLEPGTIHGYLSRSYWAEQIPLETVTRSLDGSINFALVHLGGEVPRQVGFARVISDRATFAYLCDVFVLEQHRGKRLGEWLMEVVQAHPDLQGLRRWTLFTRDAHALYRKTGFTELAKPDRAMEKVDPGIYQRAALGLRPPPPPAPPAAAGAHHAGDESEE